MAADRLEAGLAGLKIFDHIDERIEGMDVKHTQPIDAKRLLSSFKETVKFFPPMQGQLQQKEGAYWFQEDSHAYHFEVVNSEVVGRIRFTGDMPPGLRQNQRVTVRIMMDELLNVLKLQRGSFAENGGGRTAFVLADNGLAQRRAIRLGARSAGEVEVVNGLVEGDHVIISSIADFQDFETIQIVD